MKFNLIYFAFAFIVFACSQSKDYNPDSHLSPREKDAVITTIVRYASKAPDGVTGVERMSPKYDSFYLANASRIKFEQYYADDDQYYFLISQPAPSLIEKRHATGGRFKLDEKGELIEYEEVFRTWKMVPDTLKRRSYMLFDKMVKGESLTPYETKNSGGIEYIEFPDQKVSFDKEARNWSFKNE